MNTLQNKLVALALSTTILAPAMLAPSMAEAQTKAEQSKRRQQKKNEWRNIGLASAAAGVYGFVTGNKTLGLIGAAGALYSADRYERDRKSQSKIDRQRAAMYSRTSITQNGKRYVRKTKIQNGKRYYYFARAK